MYANPLSCQAEKKHRIHLPFDKNDILRKKKEKN
jgi:hypothetical protein